MLLSRQHRSPGAGRFLPAQSSLCLPLSTSLAQRRAAESLGPAATEGSRHQKTERDGALSGEAPTGANRSPQRLTKDEPSLSFYPAGELIWADTENLRGRGVSQSWPQASRHAGFFPCC